MDLAARNLLCAGWCNRSRANFDRKRVHVAHVLIDGIIGEAGNVSDAADEPLLDPDQIADAYWHLASQQRSSWTLELDVRPHREQFFV